MMIEQKMLHAFEMKLRQQRRQEAGPTRLEQALAKRKGGSHHGHFADMPKGRKRRQSDMPRSSIWPENKSVAPCRQLSGPRP